MRKKIICLIVLTLVLTSVIGAFISQKGNVQAATSFDVYGYVEGVVTSSGLNVRSGPSVNYKVVHVLYKGQKVKVLGKLGNWYVIHDPSTDYVGAVSANYMTINWPKTTPKPTPAPTPTPTPAPDIPPAEQPGTTPSDISAEEQQLLDLVNKARAEAGVGALKFDMELMKVARLKAKDMVDNNYFSHQSPTYGSPFDMMKQFNISFRTAGENIAGNRTVEGAFKAWMNSEGHRRNILNGSFNYVGFGIVPSNTYGKILVQMFIGR
ncbi:MAG TPA: SH3 domain-containing protein [Clostridiaceae bacterium]|nr:SH3 domain-containing protein [Clostridiaceae bacterium]